jgi:toxin-antitoxin system PIN domain toxin
MVALLDANLLIALFDVAHGHHQAAHHWFNGNRGHGWATCPLTQNACIRILSQPAYPGRLAVVDASRRLRQAMATADHHFWPDDLSLCDSSHFTLDHLLSSKPLTDIYLLGLATARRGCLVTFDSNIPMAAVPNATGANLIVLQALTP